jgi:outer membrane protein TolC
VFRYGSDGSVGRSRAFSPPDRPSPVDTSAGATLNLSYLLLDAGGRSATLDRTRRAVALACAQRNVAIQDVILQAESAYFRYMATRALLDAQRATLLEAQTNLNAAVARHEAELATISDVLQARTVVARSQLAVQGTQGELLTTRGALALAMGLPANTPCDVVSLPPEIPAQSVSTQVVALIERALLNRPDLAAVKARVLAAEARVRELRSAGRPSLRASGNLGRSYYSGETESSDAYGAGLTLRVPLFTGYERLRRQVTVRRSADRGGSPQDNQVDRDTGTILLKGEFANEDGALWPGQFVDVDLLLATDVRAVTVPSHAVQSGQAGQFVFVVKADSTVEKRAVEIERQFEGWPFW